MRMHFVVDRAERSEVSQGLDRPRPTGERRLAPKRGTPTPLISSVGTSKEPGP